MDIEPEDSLPLSSELARSMAAQQQQQQQQTPDYKKSLAYWESVSSDDNGMLGGFPQLSRIDVQGSSTFLAKIRAQMPKEKPWRAVDCGAGIGRVTKNFLIHKVEEVDIVEPVKKFTDELLNEMQEIKKSTTAGTKNGGGRGGGKGGANGTMGKICKVYNEGLETWNPNPRTYWMIWVQWCVGHLTNDDLIAFFKRCILGLRWKGMIVLKENICTYEDTFDEQDSSVTRTDERFREIFEKAGLKIVKAELQRGFPPSLGLYPVRMYALQPKTWPKKTTDGSDAGEEEEEGEEDDGWEDEDDGGQ